MALVEGTGSLYNFSQIFFYSFLFLLFCTINLTVLADLGRTGDRNSLVDAQAVALTLKTGLMLEQQILYPPSNLSAQPDRYFKIKYCSFYLILLCCVYEHFPVSISFHHMHSWYPQRPQEGVRCPGNCSPM